MHWASFYMWLIGSADIAAAALTAAVTAFLEHIITEAVYGQESFRTLWVYGQESFCTLQCTIKRSLKKMLQQTKNMGPKKLASNVIFCEGAELWQPTVMSRFQKPGLCSCFCSIHVKISPPSLNQRLGARCACAQCQSYKWLGIPDRHGKVPKVLNLVRDVSLYFWAVQFL